jgi:hypothetical protein
MASIAAAVPLPRSGLRFLALIAAAPLVLGIAHLLPATGAGLGIRLAAATACVLLVPGALLLRTIGWPESPAVAVAGALALGLGVVFLALAFTFAAGGSLSLTVAVIAIFSLATLAPAVTAGELPQVARDEKLAVLGVLAAGAVFGGIVWWASRTTVSGDALFHLARARKLEEFDVLSSVRTVREFADGGLHPGYGFPLWHGVLALVARFASVDVAEVVRHLNAILVPVAFVVSYGAGRALFRSWPAGIAALVGSVAISGFSRDGIGSYEVLSLPATAARLMLVPALLALVFALAQGGRWSLAAPVAAAGLALTLTHATYALFLVIPLAAILVLRAAVAPRDAAGLVRLAYPIPALLVPFVAYTVWILPVINSTIARGKDDRSRAIAHYAGQVDVTGDSFRLAPEAIARGGAVVVAALLAVPLAAFAGRRLWAAAVLGGTVSILVVVLVPQLFTPFADAVSLSQGRRLVLFLPLAFSFAGAALFAGRLRFGGVAAALALGVVFQFAYPGEFAYSVGEGGPGWAIWLALFGGIAGIGYGLWRKGDGPAATRFAALAACAFVLPVAVAGLPDARHADRPDAYALTPGLVRELRALDRRSIVLSGLETSYRIAAAAPVRIVAAPPAHVARTKLNEPYSRRRDVARFFYRPGVTDAARKEILDSRFVGWVVVDKTRAYPGRYLNRKLDKVYEDRRYILYHVPPPEDDA